MSAILIPLLFILACFSTSLGSDLSVPRWENLECEVSNHYYYFMNIFYCHTFLGGPQVSLLN